jgi:hypothetical protein
MINVNAALFASSTSMGAGVVVRDSLGGFVAAHHESFLNVQVPEVAEVTFVRAALFFAYGEHLDNLIVATYCLIVVKRVESKMKDRSSCGPIIEDIKNLIKAFISCSITHVSRFQILLRIIRQIICLVLCDVVWLQSISGRQFVLNLWLTS